MITVQRPGKDPLEIKFILIDFDGTLACDRRIHPKAKDKINLLSKRTKIFVLSQGEKEVIEESLKKVKADVIYFTGGESSQRKLELLNQLGREHTVAIGNGVDDSLMIEEAGLGICVLSKEGTAGETLRKTDVVVTNILDALDFLLKPLRHRATLCK